MGVDNKMKSIRDTVSSAKASWYVNKMIGKMKLREAKQKYITDNVKNYVITPLVVLGLLGVVTAIMPQDPHYEDAMRRQQQRQEAMADTSNYISDSSYKVNEGLQ